MFCMTWYSFKFNCLSIAFIKCKVTSGTYSFIAQDLFIAPTFIFAIDHHRYNCTSLGFAEQSYRFCTQVVTVVNNHFT